MFWLDLHALGFNKKTVLKKTNKNCSTDVGLLLLFAWIIVEFIDFHLFTIDNNNYFGDLPVLLHFN